MEALHVERICSSKGNQKESGKIYKVIYSSYQLFNCSINLYHIRGELYKVLDSSDVILEVLDARNVPGTRCAHIENHLKKNASHKQLVIIINKCDLVPNWVTRNWVKILSTQFPTLAFHASVTNSFGKGALISLLRQFAKLHSVSMSLSLTPLMLLLCDDLLSMIH